MVRLGRCDPELNPNKHEWRAHPWDDRGRPVLSLPTFVHGHMASVRVLSGERLDAIAGVSTWASPAAGTVGGRQGLPLPPPQPTTSSLVVRQV